MRFGHPAAAAAFMAAVRTFGEAVRVEPLVSSEYAEALPDPDRDPVDTFGVVTLTPQTDTPDGARSGSGKMSTTTRIAARRANVWFPPDTYAAIGYMIRAGDRIVLTSRLDEPAYVASRDPVISERGDVSINLVQDGST